MELTVLSFAFEVPLEFVLRQRLSAINTELQSLFCTHSGKADQVLYVFLQDLKMSGKISVLVNKLSYLQSHHALVKGSPPSDSPT